MLTTIGRRLRRDRRGISNIIVVVLSLVIIIAIVSNVILWSYQMNQLDWEKIREDIKISNVASINTTYSSWFVAQSEYIVNLGSHVSGTYNDTQVANDGIWETFQESSPPTRRLDINGTFTVDVSSYPLDTISTIEIKLRYRASDNKENLYLEAYNWTANTYSDNGFNFTTGHTPTTGWDSYAVNLTDQWNSYLRSDGMMYVKVRDAGNDAVRTTVDIDFLSVRVVASGTSFTFENEGSLTAHLVSLWVNNSTNHQRYDVNVFINSGETLNYTRSNISLPSGGYIVKVVTQRGNTAVFSGS